MMTVMGKTDTKISRQINNDIYEYRLKFHINHRVDILYRIGNRECWRWTTFSREWSFETGELMLSESDEEWTLLMW